MVSDCILHETTVDSVLPLIPLFNSSNGADNGHKMISTIRRCGFIIYRCAIFSCMCGFVFDKCEFLVNMCRFGVYKCGFGVDKCEFLVYMCGF